MKRIFVFLLFMITTQNVWAEYITQNIPNACDDNAYYRAVFTIKQPTCANGYFLPANAISCETCPSGYTCDGGTFSFNETESQGAIYSNTITDDMNNICAINGPLFLRAVFTPKTISCPGGKYLTANSIICDTDCPLNHYCPGGDYYFNETENGGIFPCAAGTFAPMGNAFCYEHILHIGNEYLYLRASKRTTPSLNIGYGNDVFYANMTTTPTYMTAGSSHYFKTIYNNQTYYICDDTTYNVE